MLDPVAILSERFIAAVRAAFPALEGDVDPLIAPNKNPALGDFQSNIAMGLSKRVGKPPRDVAKAISVALKADDLCEPIGESAIAGPGFINIRLRSDALAGMLAGLDTPGLGVVKPATPQTVVVDLCGVNLAKEMHVGHLRSTIIGDALARVFERLGYTVVRQNHLGDWGLPIAMVCDRVRREVEAGRVDLAKITLADLDRHYKEAQKECAPPASIGSVVEDFGHFLTSKFHAEWADEIEAGRVAATAMTRAKRALVDLQAKESGIHTVWKRIVDVTIAACAENCRKLGAIVLAEHTAGESSYADELGPAVEDVLARGVAEIDDGAVIVRLEKPEWGAVKEPCLIRKRDGGFLYATTDLCAIRRRSQKFGADRIVYCVDARQSLHFKQVFAASARAGYTQRPGKSPAVMSHAGFGMVLGDDGRPFKTRSGDNVKLADLIQEATDRAAEQMRARGADVPAGDFERTAWAVGVSAIKYADLSIERVKDYVFSFDRMVAFEGNTGPYLLYAYARLRSILRKAGEPGLTTGPFVLDTPEERGLALQLLRYPTALDAVAAHGEPHRLCQFLYDVAQAFSTFYAQHRVVDAEPAIRASRVRLCGLVSRVLGDAMTSLGLPFVDKM